MGSVPSESDVLLAARRLVEHGVAVHWLHRRKKRPVGTNWQTAPVHTIDSLKADYQTGFNIGIRPGEHSRTPYGYLHLFDVDIRKPELAREAWACLLKHWPEAREAPFVISGSGGESRHVYVFTPVPLRSMSLGHSEGFEMVFDPEKGRDVKKRDWEVSLYGAPKQAVLPPSVHPDTGENYRWGREIEWDLLEMGLGPVVSEADIATWGAREDDLSLDDHDDLMAAVRAAPMGLTQAEIDRILADLPEDWVEDHDLWVQAGMALHHEYEGSQLGFERWCEWSKQSAKFDVKDLKTRWKSFKDRKNPVRMATLIKAAGEARLQRDHADLEDLFGDAEVDEPTTGTALALLDTKTQATLDDDFLSDLLSESPKTTDPDLDTILGTDDSIAPGANGASGLGPLDPNWKSYLQMTEDGLGIKATLHNVELIIRNDPRTRGVMAFNEFTQEIVQRGTPKSFKLKKAGPKPVRQLDGHIWDVRDKVNGDLWSDSHDVGVRVVLEAPTRQGGYSLKTSDRDLRSALDKVAHLNKFHPIREYLSGLVWDGERRVSKLFVDYVGAEDNAYHREAGVLTMLAAVTRVFEPGHKFDFVPILEGLQGKRKSTFINILARHWFAELEGDFHDTKAMVEKMQGSWILEIPELQGFSKAEVTTIKGFVSRTFDKVRLAYAKRASEFHRQCIFIGSTNDVEYLRDSTGGRRFLPIACNIGEIDTDLLRKNIDQLWAEAKHLYDVWRREQPHGTLPLYMRNDEASAEAKRLQESRRQVTTDDVMAARIEHWLSQPIGSDLGGFDDLDEVDPESIRYHEEVCIAQIWEEMMGQDINRKSERDQQMLGRAMRKVEGWAPAGQTRFAKYGKQRVFRRIDPI